MTKVDMKYTSLFCRLGFIEKSTDIFVKKYSNSFEIEIEAEKQEIDYKENKNPHHQVPTYLHEHKDFVVLECVNNLLKKGYLRTDLEIFCDTIEKNNPDIIVSDRSRNKLIAFECKRWGEEFEDELVQFKQGKGILHNYYMDNQNVKFLCLYSSRLDGGLLGWKYVLLDSSDMQKSIIPYYSGIFEEDIVPFKIIPSLSENERKLMFDEIDVRLSKNEDIEDFEIKEGILVKYLGNKEHISIPNPLTSIKIGAFWNCTSLVSVKIPFGITRIGGDAFYYCKNLKEINIPSSVQHIGNDPFAGCPKITLKNESPDFVLENGVLYNKTKTMIIHYPISNTSKEFEIPESVEFIAKHTFYDCKHLTSIIIPQNVKWIENNMSAGCETIKLTNYSPYFTLENGVLYNKEKTQLYSVYDQDLEELILPSSLLTVGKNSFYNCKKLKHLVIPKSVTRIGYNPFVGCSSLKITNFSPYYCFENGLLFNQEKTKLIYCPNTSVKNSITIPEYIQTIGRNSFSYCTNLVSLVIPKTVKIIERGVFSGCINLESIVIPESVQEIGKWAFSYCKSLKKISIPKNTELGEYLFAESSVKVVRYL